MGLFRYLFSPYKCLIYTAYGYEKYFQIVNRLSNARIPYDTSVKYNLFPSPMAFPRDHQMVPYDIYVKKQDEYRALQAIQRNS